MRPLRRKLRLAGLELAELLGLTGQAVYNWDKTAGALRLRPTTRAAIRALRGIGAREAQKRLAEMKEAAKAPAKGRREKRTVVGRPSRHPKGSPPAIPASRHTRRAGRLPQQGRLYA